MASRTTALASLSAVAAALFAIIVAPALRLTWSPWKWSRISADLVVMNATIYTSDPSLPFAQAMAVRGGRILRVGSYSSVEDLVGQETYVLNLNGNVVMPGFIDSHLHLIYGGLQMGRVELRGVKSQEEFARKIKEALREPSGLLVDSAMKLVLAVIPEVSIHDRRDSLIRASKYALTRGVTTVIDFGRFFPGTSVDHIWQDFSDVYQWADSSGKMLIRVCLFFPMQTWSLLVDLIQEKGRALSQWIHLGGVKAFADGSLGSSSALFYEPYEEDPYSYGLQVTDINWLQNVTLHSDKFGLQVAIHAIGDKANDMVLDMYNTVVSYNGMRDRRFRIEHAQHLVPGSTIRFGEQRIIASVQPDHLLDDANSAEKKIGTMRAQRGSYLFRSLIDSDAILAFGSDWPVADINPLGAIKTALYRVPPGWENAWIPSERMALYDALKASTISAAYAGFLDQELGSLSADKYADFVVLPVDSWDQLAGDLPTTVLATYVNGKQAYP
ncbi:protein LONG AFTER FAR-RED 3-like isoform X2 [Musa acuminata AAA Group]|uniref:protein LONG AFTER FAR-RED 3-like isoform X2 n=1 Tax=Musa acuminata AAA Group TaxID=214697 RepID=UPI0031D9010D